MSQGGNRARPEDPRGPGRERSACVRRDRRARQDGARVVTSQQQAFLDQARSNAGRSPLYERLCNELADEPRIAEIFGRELGFHDPLALLAGIHYLVLADRATWDDVPAALDTHRAFLTSFVREQSVQTNEVQRSWMLLPCFLEVARRLEVDSFDVIELGSSAGLNLVWDRYRYRYDAGAWGPGDARLELRGEERRPVPASLLAVAPTVRSRIGIDRAPIDVTTEEGARLLKAFVWPDQTWRLDLLDRAVAELRHEPPELIRGDLAEAFPEVLTARRRDVPTLVFQTAVLGYLPPKRRKQVFAALEREGRDGGLAYVASGQPAPDVHTYWGLWLQLWPEGKRELAAHSDFHGAWLEWLL